MKVKRQIIQRADVENQNLKQSSIVVIGQRSIGPTTYRIIVNNFGSRQDAYRFCVDNEIKNCHYTKDNYNVDVKVSLLSLKNALEKYDGLKAQDAELLLEIWQIAE